MDNKRDEIGTNSNLSKIYFKKRNTLAIQRGFWLDRVLCACFVLEK